MKSTLFLSAALFVLSGAPATASPVERACLQSERPGATRALCSCIADAADMTLSNRDQRQAVRLFRDPQRAQDIRMSDRAADEAFWDRWQNFGQTAEAMCG